MKKITFILFISALLFCTKIIAQTPPPNNDICSGAEVITVGAAGVCTTTLITMDADVEDSGELPEPGCARYRGADLWYQLVMPATGGVRIETSTDDGSIDDTGMAVYSGSCGSLSLMNCNDDISGNTLFSGNSVVQPQGTTIYIRVWEFESSSSSGTFNICAYEITPPPVALNDDCGTAEPLTLKNFCDPIVGSNNATDSQGVPGAGCGLYGGRDVWYSVTVPASGKVTVETTEDDDLSIDSGAIAIYSGECNDLGLLGCDEDGNFDNTDFDFGRIELTGRTEGETLYVRVWSFDNAQLGTFKICAIDPDALSVNDFSFTDFKMYPNPVINKQQVTLKFAQNINNSVLLKVFDINGRQIIEQKELVKNRQLKFNVAQFHSGMYFVKINTGNSTLTKKLIID